MTPLEMASAKVNFDVCKDLVDVQDVITSWYNSFGYPAIVTSAKDGTHSRQTAHSMGFALDLRTHHLRALMAPMPRWEFLLTFAEGLAAALNAVAKDGVFYVILEGYHVNKLGRKIYEHIHVEWAPKGRRPNIVSFKSGKTFYFKAPHNEGALNGKTA